jgi:hypothetical protein
MTSNERAPILPTNVPTYKADRSAWQYYKEELVRCGILIEDGDDRVLQWCYTRTTGIIVLPTCFLIALLVYFLGRHH